MTLWFSTAGEPRSSENYQQTTDFYTLAYGEGQRIYSKQIEMDSLTRSQQRAIMTPVL